MSQIVEVKVSLEMCLYVCRHTGVEDQTRAHVKAREQTSGLFHRSFSLGFLRQGRSL